MGLVSGLKGVVVVAVWLRNVRGLEGGDIEVGSRRCRLGRGRGRDKGDVTGGLLLLTKL